MALTVLVLLIEVNDGIYKQDDNNKTYWKLEINYATDTYHSIYAIEKPYKNSLNEWKQFVKGNDIMMNSKIMVQNGHYTFSTDDCLSTHFYMRIPVSTLSPLLMEALDEACKLECKFA